MDLEKEVENLREEDDRENSPSKYGTIYNFILLGLLLSLILNEKFNAIEEIYLSAMILITVSGGLVVWIGSAYRKYKEGDMKGVIKKISISLSVLLVFFPLAIIFGAIFVSVSNKIISNFYLLIIAGMIVGIVVVLIGLFASLIALVSINSRLQNQILGYSKYDIQMVKKLVDENLISLNDVEYDDKNGIVVNIDNLDELEEINKHRFPYVEHSINFVVN